MIETWNVRFTIKLARTIARFGLLAALLAVMATPSLLRCQEKPEKKEPASPAPSGAVMGQPKGPAQQLAHESREAAGEEEDETAVFKRSPSVMWIAGKTGLGPQRAYQLAVFTNFLVIAIVIFWAGRKYLPGVFRARTAAIQKAMQEAQKASEEARHKLAEIDSRLSKLDVEIGAMRDAAEKEAVAEAGRIQAAAHEEAQKIIQSAEQEIAAAAKAARRQLTVYAADLAVGLAQKQIKVDAVTDKALVQNFAGQLGAEGNAGKGGN